ncbi:hypothetical protein [Polaromonas sp. JS666]|uniref:hypothetical protein n=1 Tax=Polaromonas sp. (strain JS666 / ATCC BAA-500) TaxID=296591 RepID=UPI0002E85645|nr:hypothetical protein [Polaromonas sp. JS666]
MAGHTLDARALVIALPMGEQLPVASKLDAPFSNVIYPLRDAQGLKLFGESAFFMDT